MGGRDGGRGGGTGRALDCGRRGWEGRGERGRRPRGWGPTRYILLGTHLGRASPPLCGSGVHGVAHAVAAPESTSERAAGGGARQRRSDQPARDALAHVERGTGWAIHLFDSLKTSPHARFHGDPRQHSTTRTETTMTQLNASSCVIIVYLTCGSREGRLYSPRPIFWAPVSVEPEPGCPRHWACEGLAGRATRDNPPPPPACACGRVAWRTGRGPAGIPPGQSGPQPTFFVGRGGMTAVVGDAGGFSLLPAALAAEVRPANRGAAVAHAPRSRPRPPVPPPPLP